jgi:hypothetical protein
VLFVAEPSYPALLHGAMVAERDAPIEDEGGQEDPAGVIEPAVGIDETIERYDPGEVDQALVRYWARRTYPSGPVSVNPLDRPQTFTVSRFLLNDGKAVQVLTLMPDREEAPSTVPEKMPVKMISNQIY